MFAKLAYRNVKRSARDYVIYIFTMMLVAAVMFAFHSLLFSEDVQKMFESVTLIQVMIGLGTFFVVLIIAWLINYMVQFMLKKRSREFGIYLLIGMTKRQISRLYLRENLLLGAGAFCGGLALGMLMEQMLMAVFYTMVQLEYRIHLEWNRECLLLTASCYGGCYLLALLRCRRRFRRMNIRALLNSKDQNEEVKESHEKAKQWLLPLSILFLLAFVFFLFFYKNWNEGVVLAFLTGLVLTIYIFYTGLAACIICYIRKKGRAVYHRQNLFLMRQFSSKLKTMRFTLGTLTSLFTLALLGCASALMFDNYQHEMLAKKWPFDVQVYSGDLRDTFAPERKILDKQASVRELYTYTVYQNRTNVINSWLYTHLSTFGDMYQKKDGTADWEKILADGGEGSYYPYDTWMALSDYNHLRQMLGYQPVELGEHDYALQIKERVWKEAGDFFTSLQLQVNGPDAVLELAGVYTEPFSQDGHNGADYLIIVPDKLAFQMEPYYKELAAMLKERAPDGLQKLLDGLQKDGDRLSYLGHAIDDPQADLSDQTKMCFGSDQIISYVAKNLVGANLIPEVRFMLCSLIFPLFYMGLVFVCVALTVLCVQQLSDSSRYRFRYQVLHQIGLGKQEISGVVFCQLAAFYLCPILFAALISGMISVWLGWNFNRLTGAHMAAGAYFGMSFGAFFGVYAIYFVLTYLGFLRNVNDGS